MSIVEVQKEEKVVFRCFLSFMMWKCNIGYNFWYVLVVYCVTYFHEERISHRFLGSFPRERFHPGIPDKGEKKNEFSGCGHVVHHFLRGTSCGFQWVQKPSFWDSPTPTPYLDLLWVGFNLVYFLGPCSAPFLVYQWYSNTAISRPLNLNVSLDKK